MSNNLILKNIFLINFFHINETFSFNSYSLHNTYTIHKERIKSKPEYSPYKTICKKISLHFSIFFFFLIPKTHPVHVLTRNWFLPSWIHFVSRYSRLAMFVQQSVKKEKCTSSRMAGCDHIVTCFQVKFCCISCNGSARAMCRMHVVAACIRDVRKR